jgi:hypothetical protein
MGRMLPPLGGVNNRFARPRPVFGIKSTYAANRFICSRRIAEERLVPFDLSREEFRHHEGSI